jgi:hypothetical protein
MPIVYKSSNGHRAMIAITPDDSIKLGVSWNNDSKVGIIEGPISAWEEFYFLLKDEFIGEGKP